MDRDRFCSRCGGETSLRIPAGDDRQRRVCERCGTIHYDNPKVVAGCVLTCGDRILLARRGIEPRADFWTIPAGFMENHETVLEAAARECREEALATPLDPQLYGMISLPRISQVYVIYRGLVAAGAYGVGDESTEVALFEAAELPWERLAFPIVELTLRRFLHDRKRGRYEIFDAEIRIRPGEPLPADLLPDDVTMTRHY